MLIEIQCDYCNKPYTKEKKLVNINKKKNHKNYCSPECRKLGSTNKVTFKCDYCGKEKTQSRYSYDRSKGGHFCSSSCAATVNNSLYRKNFKDGKSSYRGKAFNYYGAKCSVCGYDTEIVLQVHHRNGNRNNNEIENLDVLCPTHHVEYQTGIRKYSD
jgi:hypothetical protein